MKIGFVVNPIAGMGGKVGLKGTDGMLQEAIKKGAKKEAPQKAIKFLKALREKKIDVQIFTASHEMGEDECKDAGIKARVVYQCNNPTTAMDTKKACIEFMKHGVDAIVFVGGDGTARDVYSVVKDRIAMLGVPAGVKMYSGVFAFTPEMAAEVIANFDGSVDAEIIDIDEEAFRKDKLELKIYGYAKTLGGNVQQGKILIASDKEMKESIASFMALICRKGSYIIGGGSTTYAIKKALGIEGSFLGVDVVKDGKLVIKDANEEQLLDFLSKNKARIIVAPLSNGFIFGRGNQQISWRVIKKVGKNGIIVVATPQKLALLKKLRVDADEVNEILRGEMRVIIGFGLSQLMEVE